MNFFYFIVHFSSFIVIVIRITMLLMLSILMAGRSRHCIWNPGSSSSSGLPGPQSSSYWVPPLQSVWWSTSPKTIDETIAIDLLLLFLCVDCCSVLCCLLLIKHNKILNLLTILYVQSFFHSSQILTKVCQHNQQSKLGSNCCHLCRWI